MSEKIIVELSEPIQAHGETLHQIELRAPRAGDMRKIKGNPMHDMFDMAAQYVTICGNIPPSSVDQMCGADFNGKILSIFTDFFDFGQETTKTSSAP